MTGTPGGGLGRSSPEPDDINEHLDDIAAELSSEARFREPSAAERAQHSSSPAPNPTRRRRDARIAAKLREPILSHSERAALRTPKVAREKKRRSRRRSKFVAGAVILVAVAIAAVLVLVVPKLLLPAHRGGSPATVGSRAGVSPRQPAFTTADPFAGTPAENFANGASGIVPPAAKRVGIYSAAQVKNSYLTVRRMLIAANLNRTVLAGGSPTAFSALLIATQRAQFWRDLNKSGRDKTGHARSSRDYVTSFSPNTTVLVGSTIKVHGFMAATPAHEGPTPVLRIRADYLFVYPVQRAAGPPSTRLRIVQRMILTVDFAAWDDPGGALEPFISRLVALPAGVQCGVEDGFLHPGFPSASVHETQPPGPAINPYDQSIQPSNQTCRGTTGT